MGRSGVVAAVTTGVLLATSAATIGSTAASEPLKLSMPAVSGKYEVGARSLEVVDRSRVAGFGRTGKRRLMVQVTYPRGGATTCRDAAYMPPETQDVLLSFIALDGPVSGRTGVCELGPVRRGEHPLLVFSHAYTANRSVYTALISDLASRGFVVASVDHTSDAFAVKFPTGPVVRGVFGSPLASKQISESELASLIEVRTADVRFVTTKLLAMNRTRSDQLFRAIDPRRIGVLGHSLGGATAVRAATVDKRFRASADIDGSLFGGWAASAKSRKPLLLFVGEDGLGAALPQDKACRFFANAAKPKLAWQLTGAKHLAFSDFQTLAPQIATARPSWQFATLYPAIIGNLDPVASVASQRAALARFFTAYLGGRKPKSPPPPPGVQALTGSALNCAT